MTDTPTLDRDIDHYEPGGFSHAIASELNGPDAEPFPQRQKVVAGALVDAFDAIAAGQPPAWPFPQLDYDYHPRTFALSMARRMAGPLWERYSCEQKRRAMRYAARYSARRLRSLHFAPHPISVPSDVYSALPDEVRRYQMQLWHDRSQLERRQTMVNAYLAVHTDDEFVPAELRQVVQVAEMAFF